MTAILILFNSLLLFLMLLSFRKRRGRGGGVVSAPIAPEKPPISRQGATERPRSNYDTGIITTLETMLQRAIEEEQRAAAVVERSEYMNSFCGVVVGEKTYKKQLNELYTAQRKRIAIELRLQRERQQ